ncbi:putative RING finger protein P8B7.15c [Golovinomyces cichoracearum]|uniref:Putative RING finger protein P8B7.15c n=1 Tax=Golovinomyces cichoracearum TaxID=62708 RepID=A0A420IPG3_9PEZI|nr:putative RING finger protein P8B7.15c [Golovinomyces cichoracearum]
MSSSVFYKFKSQKEPSRVEFEGTGISVYELKRDIIIKSGLGDGADFDLSIFNDDGTEEYDDDTAVIPRSTTVIARRLPAAKKGAGRAQRYMTGKMPINSKSSIRKEQVKPSSKSAISNSVPQTNSVMSEEQRLAAMFEASSQQWSGQLEEMAKQTKVHHNGTKKFFEGEPPLGYVCYRCGEKGHWIKECPTNDDPSFENKPRIKRTTGIPRSFLRAVDKPMSNSSEGDDVKQHSGVMINAEGQFVIAEPDKKSWEIFQAKTKSSAAAERVAAVGSKEIQDRGLECSIDKRIFIDPMKTPCCEKTYCNDCITNSLIESDFTCPGCQTIGVLLDDLKQDEVMSLKIQQYLEEKNAMTREDRDKPKSPLVNVQPSMNLNNIKSKSPLPPVLKNFTAVPNSPSLPSSDPRLNVTNEDTNDSKKRSAEQVLENPKIPKGPKAMQQQQHQQQQQQQQQQQPQQQKQPKQIRQQPLIVGMNSFGTIPFGMPYYGMSNMMNGFGGMNNMSMMPVVNPMMMNGYSGFSNMYPGMNGYNSMPNINMMSNSNIGIGCGLPMSCGNGVASGFPNQQKTIFAEPLPNEEDNAYFRQPVNPHRHQGRQRRARPQDYRML